MDALPTSSTTTPWPVGTLLARLDKSSRHELLALGVPRKLQTGDVLFRQGARDSHVVLLLPAIAKITCMTPDGREALLAIRVTGDTVGEMAALNGHPRSATVNVCAPGTARIIPQAQFRAFLHSNARAALEFAGMVADRLRWANRRRVDFTAYPTKVRLARVMAELARAYGHRTTEGITVGMSLTQPELAALCAAAEVTVQKALRELRDAGLVQTGYRRITVLDLPRLRAAANLDDSA